jgi:ER-bound oxygenase mpaB/B'/Rubber oxygenase, catalytic domain
MLNRYKNLNLIQQLDPKKDHIQIAYMILGYEFCWDTVRSLEVALMRTYCIPSISKLLNKTGEFIHRPQKRYDDTTIILTEIIKWGYDSERGKEALEKMNAIHRRFQIANPDFLYVLSTFIYEPIRWNQRFGWRQMCETEKLGTFYFWQEVGKRMDIANIPETYAEFERYNQEYEKENFRYSETNQRVGEATRDLFLSWFPKWMKKPLKPITCTLLDDTILDAFGFEHPTPFLRHTVENILKFRAKILQFFPPRNQAYFLIDSPTRTYPTGYEIDNLDPIK